MKTNLTNGLCGLCAILLIVVLVFQFKQQARLDALQRQQETSATAAGQQQQEQRDTAAKLANQVTNLGVSLESRLAQNEQQTKEKTTEIANIVQQQTAVMHRALGKVIPVELPEALTRKLSALETRISNEKSWPKDAAEADTMLAELRSLMRQIPPWAEEDLLPRLNALRWGASGLVFVVRSQSVTNGALADSLDEVDTALEAKPDGASELVANQLTAIQATLKSKSDSFRRDNAIANAEHLIKDGGAAADFSEVHERLSEWVTVPELKERIEKLQHGVRARVLSDDTTTFAASVDASLIRLRGEPSVMVRQISLGKLLDSVVSQRQMVLENSDADEMLPRKLAALSTQVEKAIEVEGKTQTAEQEKKLRNYQSRALAQIQKFNDDMSLAEKADKGVVYNSPDYTRIKNDMVNYLVPISVGLLDPAVARLYNEAFERGWKQLDGKNQKYLQTEVANQEASVEKQKP